MMDWSLDRIGPSTIAHATAYKVNLKFTGLAQNSQVGPAVWLEIPIVAVKFVKLSQMLCQPCEFCLVSEALWQTGRCGGGARTTSGRRRWSG
jgi:hypothetical protein